MDKQTKTYIYIYIHMYTHTGLNFLVHLVLKVTPSLAVRPILPGTTLPPAPGYDQADLWPAGHESVPGHAGGDHRLEL